MLTWLGLSLRLAAALLLAVPFAATATGTSGLPALAIGCADADPPLITDHNVRQAPPLPEPAARLPFRDPVFGTCLTRVTDRRADLATGDPSRGLKNEYARVQAFNADETRLLVRGLAATWYLYDAATLAPMRKLDFEGSVEPRWDAADPDLLTYSAGTRLVGYNTRTGAEWTRHDFADDFPGQALTAVWTRYEGSPSLDGRYRGLMAEDEEYLPVAFLVYDQLQDRVVSVRDLRGLPARADDVDHVSISPLGTYLLASFDRYCAPGQLGNDANPCGLMVYDRDLQQGRGLLRIVGHYDLALDAAGREVVVFQDIDTDTISLLELATGRVTPLWPIEFQFGAIGLHFSGQAHRQPGWVLVSTHDATRTSATWLDDQIIAIELKAGGRVVRLAHTHSLVDPDQEHDYWAEPHATVNRDFTRVLFTTNWGRSGTEEVEVFHLALPAGWPARLP